MGKTTTTLSYTSGSRRICCTTTISSAALRIQAPKWSRPASTRLWIFKSAGLFGGYDSDAEGLPGQGTLGGFGEKAIRRNFVKKVYGILFCQLLLTFAIVLPFAFHQPLRSYVRRNTALYWVAFVVVIVCLISMACCEGVRRKFPKNIIFLGVFTAAEGFMLGCFCARFDADAILYAIRLAP